MGKLKLLTTEQKNFYSENGFIKLENIFTPKEIVEISEEYDDIFERKKKENLEGLETAWIGDDMKIASENRNVTVKSVANLEMHSAVFTKILFNQKLLDAIEDIMDTKDILLHHTKAHLKPPKEGAPYLMHQDYPYFPFKKHTMLAVFLHLDDSTPENGGLCIYPGSHKLGPLPSRTIFVNNNKKDPNHYADPDLYPISKADPVEAKKGDIVVFSYLTLHGSYLNLSERPRRMFLIQLRAADDEPIEDIHKTPYHSLVLRGKNIYRKVNKGTKFVD